MKRSSRLLGAITALALVAAACGSDDEGSDDTSPEPAATEAEETPATDAPPETEAPAEEPPATDAPPETEAPAEEPPATDAPEEAPELSGDPVLVGFVGTSVIAGVEAYDALIAGLDAATLAINGDGGIDGRPIEVRSCDDSGDPNLALQCAQELIDDGVVAFVANFTSFGEAVNPIIGEAGQVIIGGGLFTPGDFGVPHLYATNGGAFTAGAGGPVACIIGGGSQLAYAFNDVPAGQQVPPLVEALVTGPRDGIDLVHTEPIAVDLADFAPAAAKIIAANPDCVTAGIVLQQVPLLITALRDQGYAGKIQIAGDFTTVDGVVDSLDGEANDIVTSNIYDLDSPGYAEYVDAVAAMTGDDSTPLSLGVMGWLGLHIAADVIRAAGDDPAAIAAATPEVVVDYDTGGLTAMPLDWSVPGENPLGLENVRDVSVIAREIVDGEAVAIGGWEPIFVS